MSGPGDEEQKRFARRAVLERDERVDRIAIDAAAKAVHRLGGIREHASHFDLLERRPKRGLDLFGRPEWNRECVCPHSGSVKSASARAKSVSSVIFIARSLPRTTSTGIPEPLAQRGVVGGADPLRLRLAMRAHDHLARKSLRRLRAPQSVSLDRARDASVSRRPP